MASGGLGLHPGGEPEQQGGDQEHQVAADADPGQGHLAQAAHHGGIDQVDQALGEHAGDDRQGEAQDGATA